VVTPVYNGEPYLAECIESVLNQTYQNWEYILVNNCSKDTTLETMQHYADLDPRIRVFDNQDFLSQFQNWNHAMRLISRDSVYCKVIHADDWIYPECIAEMVTLAEEHPSIGIVGAYRLTQGKVDLDSIPCAEPRRTTVMPGRKLCHSILLGMVPPFGSPTSLLLRSDIVRARPKFYDESIVHADADVCYALLQETDFGFVHRVLTFTRMHEASITSRTERFRTGRLANFAFLLRYGPTYLAPAEYRKRLKMARKAYHRFLAQSVYESKGKAFWEFHRAELDKLGQPIHRPTLIALIALELLNPRQTWHRWRNARRENRKQGDYAAKFGAAIGSILTSGENENARLAPSGKADTAESPAGSTVA
jgi:glycosyltransferase involved in cell wall biosynthesis